MKTTYIYNDSLSRFCVIGVDTKTRDKNAVVLAGRPILMNLVSMISESIVESNWTRPANTIVLAGRAGFYARVPWHQSCNQLKRLIGGWGGLGPKMSTLFYSLFHIQITLGYLTFCYHDFNFALSLSNVLITLWGAEQCTGSDSFWILVTTALHT